MNKKKTRQTKGSNKFVMKTYQFHFDNISQASWSSIFYINQYLRETPTNNINYKFKMFERFLTRKENVPN